MDKRQLEQIELIPQIKRLCIAGKYDEAIKLTDQIHCDVISIKARLLCIEHEHVTKIKQKTC